MNFIDRPRNLGNFPIFQVNWHSYFENGRVVFTYLSEDEEEGYPGDLLTTVTYQIVQENRLKVTFDAVCTQMTVVNLTNHSYFNLAGHVSISFIIITYARVNKLV